ncbi:ATP-binding cassette domain-containing protein [Phenylobacterium soli]|uniref:Glucan ABC transporter ATP-binding protein/ permease n=1 Tax=Phenylobacterium soli TaxID=2170551 RepID=A0A328AMS7_9CAUL|nr:ATP-binding cassette domain-containing protein [Phenylobacterium soli]RAK55276.1 glucan ABC transporter ATP-binding protein/ permease [Phenylobacterium soli]
MLLATAYARGLSQLRTEARAAILVMAANLALGALALLDPILFGKVIGALAQPGGHVWRYIAAWASLSVISVAAGVTASVFADRIAHRRRLAAMTRAFDNAITLPIARVSARGTGKLMQVVFAGGEALFQLLLGFMREQLPAIFALALLFPVAFSMNVAMASVLAALAVVYVAANLLVMRKTETGQQRVNEEAQAYYGRLGDVISNVPVVQAYANLKSETAALQALTGDLLKALFPVIRWYGVLTVLTRAASTLALVAIFGVGAWLAQHGRASLGEIVSFGGFAGLLIGRLDTLSGSISGVVRNAPAMRNFFDLVDERPGSPDRPDAEALEDVRGQIAFERVSHWIVEEAELGLFDVSLEVPAGATVALVGHSGAGKTTMMALMQRLRDPDLGEIRIDGRDIRRLTLASLRQAIGVVFQDAGLFNRSIADNLRLARPGASEAELTAALEAAQAWEFVKEKPGGLDYVIGERGQLLSGGERQRLAIARAILKDAPILILDEATSALDTVTEAKVKQALDAAAQGRTTFIIAHRLSTVMDADLILVLEKGRIVERGTFESLVASGGRFAEMAQAARLTDGGAFSDAA